jgi:photosystem II stability/assembly factor-like uncharacterized protein
MLHTRDGGKQFERIPVSPKLPGEPTSIKGTGIGKAEMITSQGAVYTTVNGGLNWKAQVHICMLYLHIHTYIFIYINIYNYTHIYK